MITQENCRKVIKIFFNSLSNVQVKISQVLVLSFICIWCSITLLVFENNRADLNKRIAYLERREKTLEDNFIGTGRLFGRALLDENIFTSPDRAKINVTKRHIARDRKVSHHQGRNL